MKTAKYIVLYIAALVLSSYFGYEYFFRAVGGKSILPFPNNDNALYAFLVLGSGILTFAVVSYLVALRIRQEMSNSPKLNSRALLLMLLIVTCILAVNISPSVFINGESFGITEVASVALPLVLLLSVLFIRRTATYVALMVVDVVFILFFIMSVWTNDHYSLFEFLGGGTLDTIATLFGGFFFAFFARKDLMQTQAIQSSSIAK